MDGDFCLVCHRRGQGELLAATPALPATGHLLATGEPPLPLRSIRFLFCPDCGFIWQERRAESLPDYCHLNRTTRAQLPVYTDAVLVRTRAYCQAKEPRIADIGCNDGAFLTLAVGHGYDHRLGVEPSQKLAEVCSLAGHPTECMLFGHAAALDVLARFGKVDVLFARHVFEHVPDPADFLAGLHAMLAQDGVLFLEVPDTASTIRDLLGHELWDEHLSYFTARTLRRLLVHYGFEVLELTSEPHRAGRNLLCWARLSKGEGPPVRPEDSAQELTACRAFSPAWAALGERLRTAVQGWSGPVAALGASHPQLNFLWYTGLASYVEVLLDNDAAKQGQFLQLQRPTLVVSARELWEEWMPGTLLCTAFGCGDWTVQMVAVARRRGVRVVDPYAL